MVRKILYFLNNVIVMLSHGGNIITTSAPIINNKIKKEYFLHKVGEIFMLLICWLTILKSL